MGTEDHTEPQRGLNLKGAQDHTFYTINSNKKVRLYGESVGMFLNIQHGNVDVKKIDEEFFIDHSKKGWHQVTLQKSKLFEKTDKVSGLDLIKEARTDGKKLLNSALMKFYMHHPEFIPIGDDEAEEHIIIPCWDTIYLQDSEEYVKCLAITKDRKVFIEFRALKSSFDETYRLFAL